MKCIHGFRKGLKCPECFKRLVKRVSVSEKQPEPAVVKPEAKEDLFLLGSIQIGIDKNPRPL